MFRRRGAADERERVEAFHGFLRGELTKELRQAIKLVQTESASQQHQAALGIFGFITPTKKCSEFSSELYLYHFLQQNYKPFLKLNKMVSLPWAIPTSHVNLYV